MELEILITNHPLDIENIIESNIVGECGGINIFIGTVRNQTNGKAVLHLEYEAYVPMAEKEIKTIVEEASGKWKLLKVVIHHRTGTLKVREKAVVISASAAHRDEAFQCCRYLIEELKKRVPIWKKEVFEDGEEWVSAHP